LIETNDILKYIEGRLSEHEARKVRSWIDSSNKNHDEYEFYKSVLSESSKLNDIVTVDEGAAWDDFVTKTDFRPANRFNRRLIFGIAASFILIAAVLSVILWPRPLYKELTTFTNQDTIKLVDGSTIFVNDSSKVKYYARLTKKQNERNIEVTGSATFDIALDKNRPFVVKANGAGVRVLGTIFNINVQGNRVECENIDGQVNLYEWKNPDNNLILNKGEKAVFENGVISLILPEPPPPVKPVGNYRSVEFIIEYLFERYYETFTTAPYADINMNDKVFVNLRQPLKDIVAQLDTTSKLKFRQNCPECYEFTVFKAK
jgi:ferric-dicitrate binding protein FerR (iron transport regulator)